MKPFLWLLLWPLLPFLNGSPAVPIQQDANAVAIEHVGITVFSETNYNGQSQNITNFNDWVQVSIPQVRSVKIWPNYQVQMSFHASGASPQSFTSDNPNLPYSPNSPLRYVHLYGNPNNSGPYYGIVYSGQNYEGLAKYLQVGVDYNFSMMPEFNLNNGRSVRSYKISSACVGTQKGLRGSPDKYFCGEKPRPRLFPTRLRLTVGTCP